jgi:hypothetical protein
LFLPIGCALLFRYCEEAKYMSPLPV